MINDKIFIADEREPDYEKMERFGQKLGIPIPQTFIEIQVWDGEGKVLEHYQRRSHSWQRNAYVSMLTILGAVNGDDITFGAGLLSTKTTAAGVSYGDQPLGVGPSSNAETAGFGYRGASGSAVYGIVVGTDDTAWTFEDYALGTLIAEGTGGGQMSYILQEVADHSGYVAGTKTFPIVHIRYINNNSGGSIGVNEVGIYANYGSAVMAARDVLGATVTVPNTGQLKVTYTISLVFTA